MTKKVTNNITLDNDTLKALSDLKNQLIQDEDLSAKNRNLTIKKAILFTAEYYKLRFYGTADEIEKQLYD